MALETLLDITEIDGFEVGVVSPVTSAGARSAAFAKYVLVNHESNTLAFAIQNGPIKEYGVNGCQVDTLIAAAHKIIHGLNEKFPCNENAEAMAHLRAAGERLKARKKDREKRGVEGLNKD